MAEDAKLAAQLLNCKVSEIDRTERDIDGGLRVWHHGTFKYFTPARVAVAESATEPVRDRMIVDDDPPAPVAVEKKTRGKRA